MLRFLLLLVSCAIPLILHTLPSVACARHQDIKTGFGFSLKPTAETYRRKLLQRNKKNEEMSSLDRVEVVFESTSCAWNANLESCDVSIVAAADYYLQVEVPDGAVGADNLVDMAFSLTDCSIETERRRCTDRPECGWFGEFCDSVLFKMSNECFGKAGDALRRNCTGIANWWACDRVTGCVYDRSARICTFDLNDFFSDIRERPGGRNDEVAPVGVSFSNNTQERLLRKEAECMATEDPEDFCVYPCFFDKDTSVCTLDKNYLVQSLRYRRTGSRAPNACSIYDAVVEEHPAVPMEEQECLVLEDDNGACQWNPSSGRCLPSQLSILKAITRDQQLIKNFEDTKDECLLFTEEDVCGNLS